jgi:hypothetical protein
MPEWVVGLAGPAGRIAPDPLVGLVRNLQVYRIENMASSEQSCQTTLSYRFTERDDSARELLARKSISNALILKAHGDKNAVTSAVGYVEIPAHLIIAGSFQLAATCNGKAVGTQGR